jgi:hypothetical protein
MYVNECSFMDSFESSDTSHIGVRQFEASEEIERLAILMAPGSFLHDIGNTLEDWGKCYQARQLSTYM